MHEQIIREAGPVRVRSYEWYDVLDDFIQGRTAMAIDSSILATDISNPRKAVWPSKLPLLLSHNADGRAAVPLMSHWQARQCQLAEQASRFPLSAVGDEQAESRAGHDARVGLIEQWLQKGVRRAKH
jgi:hypothetical protein